MENIEHLYPHFHIEATKRNKIYYYFRDNTFTMFKNSINDIFLTRYLMFTAIFLIYLELLYFSSFDNKKFEFVLCKLVLLFLLCTNTKLF